MNPCLAWFFPDSSAGKESACNTGNPGLNSGSGRSPGKGIGYPLQYSGLENSMDCIVHGLTKSQTQLRDFTFFSQLVLMIYELSPAFYKEVSGTLLKSQH